MSTKLATKTIPVTRMDCPTCISLLEREVKRLEGVDKVQGNYIAKTLKVTYDPDRVQLDEIEDAIERIGYRIAYKKYPGILSKLKGLVKREKADAIATLTEIEFPGKVLHASRPVAVLFSSPTCPASHFFKGRSGKSQRIPKTKSTSTRWTSPPLRRGARMTYCLSQRFSSFEIESFPSGSTPCREKKMSRQLWAPRSW